MKKLYPKSRNFAVLACLALISRLAASDIQSPAIESTKEVQLGQRTVTIVKIAPPVLHRAALPAAPVAQPLTSEDARREAKKQDRIEIIATVYSTDPVFSLLKVRGDGEEYEYVSNVDFGNLTQVGGFESNDTVYDWFPWVYDGGNEDVSYPAGLRTDKPSFLPVGQCSDYAQHVLTVIHDYYAANKAKLVEDRLQREALSAVQAEELKKNPPHKQPATLRFWELPATEQK